MPLIVLRIIPSYEKGLLHWDLPPVRQSLSLFWQGTVWNGVICTGFFAFPVL